MKIKKNIGFTASLLLIAGSSQIGYFSGKDGLLFVLLGILLGLIFIIHEGVSLDFGEVLIALTAFVMLLLSLLMLALGEDGGFAARPIYLYSLALLVSLFLAFGALKKRDGLDVLLKLMMLMLGLEMLIVLGQFTHLTFGFGFSKIVEDENDAGFISGSFGNPNNSAAFMGLLIFVLTSILASRGRLKAAAILMSISFPAIFITMSRTMLVFWVLTLIGLVAVTFVKKKINNSFSKLNIVIYIATASVIMYAVFMLFVNLESAVVLRSLVRIATLAEAGGDSSIDFRIISHTRLIENVFNLGVGTFSDLNYFRYYDAGDPWLMKVNPHSYIVEYSFLFGSFGLLIILAINLLLMYRIVKNENINYPFKLIACVGLLFIQAVPSSLLTSAYFFIPFVVLAGVRSE